MLRAFVFDFDGVIVNSEPVHMTAFQEILRQERITLTEEEYRERYLAMDDRGCFRAVLQARREDAPEERIRDLVARKSTVFAELIRTRLTFLPGAVDFIRRVSARYPAAVGSGALRDEIENALGQADIQDCFQLIVSAEDVVNGKPDPECYRTVLKRLNATCFPVTDTLLPGQCLVIEDSIHGVKAARLNHMKCLAVTNSYSAEELQDADKVVPALSVVSLEDCERMFRTE